MLVDDGGHITLERDAFLSGCVGGEERRGTRPEGESDNESACDRGPQGGDDCSATILRLAAQRLLIQPRAYVAEAVYSAFGATAAILAPWSGTADCRRRIEDRSEEDPHSSRGAPCDEGQGQEV